MDAKTFDAVVEHRIDLIRSVLKSKADEYATNGDRLHNFRVIAALNGVSMESANWSLACKHLVSIRDMALSGKPYSWDLWREKVGDAINYLILLEAIVQERMNAEIDRELQNTPAVQEAHLEMA